MSVTESPDNIEIARPDGDYILLQPFKYLHHSYAPRTSLLVLNQSLEGMNVRQLWDHTELHVCADGGANRLYDYFEDEQERVKYIPHFITGDFDSLAEKTREYYESKGAIIIKQSTQYATDFDKALKITRLYFHSQQSQSHLLKKHAQIDTDSGLTELEENFTAPDDSDITKKIYVYALGGIGGRFDQTIGSIHQLYKLSKQYSYLELTFITSSDIIFLAKKGVNYIAYPSKKLWNEQDIVPVCGLLPLGNTTVTLNTSGLKYDVHDWPSDMLNNVSSSNGICGTNGVIVESTDDIVINIVIDHHQV